MNLSSDMFAHGDFVTTALWNPTFTGNGNKLAVGGAFVDGMVLDHVLFEGNGTPTFPSNGTLGRFDNVSFVNYNPSDIQLDIIDPGDVSPYTLNNISFNSPPTRGVGAYIRATDSDGLTPYELQINVTVTSPVTCSGADFIAGAQSDIIASCSMQFDEITAGRAHACGITAAGVAYCWGNNAVGQLGDGTNIESNVPVLVSGGLTFQQISAGSDHTCGITFTNDGYCWGENSLWGQLGDGTATDRNAPVLVFGSTGMFNSISAGNQHTCAVTSLGAGYCWGKNTEGQLGDGSINTALTPVPVSVALTFKMISAGTGPSGSAHTCGTVTGDVAYCWGANAAGELGTGNNTPSLVPVAVSGGSMFFYIASGNEYTCAVTLAGAGECWGANADGQLGDGTTTPRNAPVSVTGVSGLDGISTGSRFACATSLGSVYCWGNNGSGQLGDGTNISSSSPVMVTGGWILPDLGSSVSEHMCATTAAGAMFCWGRGGNGRLGNGGTVDSNVPVLVSGS